MSPSDAPIQVGDRVMLRDDAPSDECVKGHEWTVLRLAGNFDRRAYMHSDSFAKSNPKDPRAREMHAPLENLRRLPREPESPPLFETGCCLCGNVNAPRELDAYPGPARDAKLCVCDGCFSKHESLWLRCHQEADRRIAAKAARLSRGGRCADCGCDLSAFTTHTRVRDGKRVHGQFCRECYERREKLAPASSGHDDGPESVPLHAGQDNGAPEVRATQPLPPEPSIWTDPRTGETYGMAAWGIVNQLEPDPNGTLVMTGGDLHGGWRVDRLPLDERIAASRLSLRESARPDTEGSSHPRAWPEGACEDADELYAMS